MTRFVCSSRPSRKRLCTLATTNSKRSSTSGDSRERHPPGCRFYSLQYAEAATIAPVKRIDHLMLRLNLIEVKAARIVGGLRVVGNAEIGVAAVTRCSGHLFKCVDTVREVGVQVKPA